MKKLVEGPGIICSIVIPTTVGNFTARYSATGLARLNFPANGRAGLPLGQRVPKEIRPWHRLTESALKNILAGKAPKKFPPFDLSAGTEFQQSVWRGMLEITIGKTISYGELASVIRNPKAVRAVGGACGANPSPVLIPCHRVLAAGGKLGGFSSGLDWKRKLLAIEGQTGWE
jgi:O-6-methylguanine DNA methyltransferase